MWWGLTQVCPHHFPVIPRACPACRRDAPCAAGAFHEVAHAAPRSHRPADSTCAPGPGDHICPALFRQRGQQGNPRRARSWRPMAGGWRPVTGSRGAVRAPLPACLVGSVAWMKARSAAIRGNRPLPGFRCAPSRLLAALHVLKPGRAWQDQGNTTPAFVSRLVRVIRGRPMRAVGSSPSMPSNRVIPRASDLKLPAQL